MRYFVGRSTVSGGPYKQVGNTAATEYADSDTAKDTKYYYVVIAGIEGDLFSEPSQEVSVKTGK